MAQGIDLLPALIPGEEVRENPVYDKRKGDPKGPSIVIVYNDDWHTFEQVEIQLQKATGCTLEKAEALAMEIDSTGRSVVFSGSAELCEKVANILRQIRLQVETDRV